MTQLIPRIVLLVTFVGGSLPGSAVYAQIVGSQVEETRPRDLIVIGEGQDTTPRRLRTFPGPIAQSSPSNTGRYVGVLVVDAPASGGLFTLTFQAVDGQGRVIATSRGAQDFKFSPTDRYVALNKGQPYEGAEGFLPEATEVIDLLARRSWTIPELKDATEVDWTNLPGEGLTLMGRRPGREKPIWKYRLSNRKSAPTDYLSTHFSPDGDYYYLTPREAMDLGMCQVRPGVSCLYAYTRANRRVQLNLSAKSARPTGWVQKGGHRLLVTESPAPGPKRLKPTGKILNIRGLKMPTTQPPDRSEELEVDVKTGRTRRLGGRFERTWHVRPGYGVSKDRAGRMRVRKPAPR